MHFYHALVYFSSSLPYYPWSVRYSISFRFLSPLSCRDVDILFFEGSQKVGLLDVGFVT